jgi:hypothetical protein
MSNSLRAFAVSSLHDRVHRRCIGFLIDLRSGLGPEYDRVRAMEGLGMGIGRSGGRRICRRGPPG